VRIDNHKTAVGQGARPWGQVNEAYLRYSVPFVVCGVGMEVRGCAEVVQVVHAGRVVAEHPRHSRAQVVLDPAHYEGPCDARVAPDFVVRLHAGTVLAGMGSEDREAVPALVELLQAGEVPDRKLAALTLGYLGPAAAAAVPALLLAVRDAAEGVRKMAHVALDRIGPPTPRAEAA
jgi:hypothetical protein